MTNPLRPTKKASDVFAAVPVTVGARYGPGPRRVYWRTQSCAQFHFCGSKLTGNHIVTILVLSLHSVTGKSCVAWVVLHIMDEEYLIFADVDSFYPGQVVRTAQPVDWSSLLQLSIQRQRAYNQKKKQSSSNTQADAHSANGVKAAPSKQSTHVQTAPTPSRLKPSVDALVVNPGAAKILTSSPARQTTTIFEKLQSLLEQPTLSLDTLRKLAWAGLPVAMRAPVWKLLLGYAPTTTARRHDTLERKRREYREAVEQHYVPERPQNQSPSLNATQMYARHTSSDDVTMRQIAVDIPRTSPGQQLFQIPQVQLALQRVLYVWAMRHPASGYVQGMNDLVTPFMYVFLSEYVKDSQHPMVMHATDLSFLENAETALANAEADSYWCLTALLNDIQDYYTFSQPGIQRRVHFLRELVSRVDSNLCSHLEEQGLDFLQFAFRWMNCLLMRELPFSLIVRVWDTYIAEADGFAVFHVYVCAALLVSFSEELLAMEFQDLVMFLQNLPTQQWTDKNMDIILSQAYMWRTIFGAAPSHLQ